MDCIINGGNWLENLAELFVVCSFVSYFGGDGELYPRGLFLSELYQSELSKD